MSLINKMLQDLEERDRLTSGEPAPVNVAHENLRAVRYAPESKSSTRLWLLTAMLVVVAGVAGAYYFFDISWQPSSTVAAPTPIPAPVPRAAAPVLEEKTVATAPVESVSIETSSSEEAKPLPVPDKKIAITEVVPTPKPVTPNLPLTSAVKPVSPALAPRTTVVKTIANETPDSGKSTIEKHDRPVTPQERAEGRYRDGAQYASQGRAEDARAALNAALSIYPAHHQARELAVALAMQNGRLSEAQELLSQGLKIAPAHLSFSQLLARVYLEQGADAQAIATLENARSAGAGNADYLSLLGALYQRSGRHADAVKAYRDATSVRATDARAWLGLGIALEATQDNSAAASAYTRALQLGLDAKLTQYAEQRLAAVKK